MAVTALTVVELGRALGEQAGVAQAEPAAVADPAVLYGLMLLELQQEHFLLPVVQERPQEEMEATGVYQDKEIALIKAQTAVGAEASV